jgi:hypothetical protein
MREAKLEPASVAFRRDQRTTHERLRPSGLVAVEERPRERLANSNQLEHPALGRIELTDPCRDQLQQPSPGPEWTPPPPQPRLVDEQAALEALEDEFAHHERYPPAHLPEPVLRLTVDIATDHPLDQLAGLLERERLQLQVLAAVVLPDRDHRVRHRLAAPDRRDHRRLACGGDLLHEHCRSRIEQVRVVDEQDDPTTVLASADGPTRTSEQLRGRRVHIAVHGEETGKRAERNRAPGLRRRHPHRRAAAVCRGFEHLRRQPRLPHARRPRDHDPGRVASSEQLLAERKLLASTDER